MTFAQLKNFTYAELAKFTYGELALPIDELLLQLKSRNAEIPIETYEKLLSIANKCEVKVPESVQYGIINSRLTIDNKIAILAIIVQILIALLSPNDKTETNTTYNVYNNVNVQIQASMDGNETIDFESLCDEIQHALETIEQKP